jgi:hypothetical protein
VAEICNSGLMFYNNKFSYFQYHWWFYLIFSQRESQIKRVEEEIQNKGLILT